MAQESTSYVLGGINNQITDEFGTDNDMVVTGGGRGWTATTTRKGLTWKAKGTSKIGAAEALYALFAENPDNVVETDEGDFDGMTEGEAERCVAECMVSVHDYCECKCGGVNHGALSGRKAPAIMLGNKTCACGCGKTTQRKYVPGHDARHHTALAAEAVGLSVDAYRASLRTARNLRAAASRKVKRAAIKAGAEKIAAAAKAGTLAPKPVRRHKAIKPQDDLPF